MGGFSMRIPAALLGLLLLAVPLGASAPVPVPVPAPALAAVAEAEAIALLGATPGDALRALAAKAGLSLVEAEAPARGLEEALASLAARAGWTPSPADWAGLRAGLASNPALAAPLARILAAVAAAAELRDEAFAALDPEEQAFLEAHAALPFAGEAAVATLGPAAAPAAPGPAVEGAARQRARDLAARVDLARLAAAQALVLDASMDALPALREAAALVPSIDQPQTHTCSPGFGAFLCVDQAGADTWDLSYWVAIDLAGNDAWVNNQGSSGGGILVAALVDVAGTDTYSTVLSGAPSSLTVATQGAGVSGVGLLLDAAGIDSYTARASLTPGDLTNPAPSATVYAQGAGVSGAGALVDLQGPNSFTAEATTKGGSALVVAQGASTTGVGLLVASGPEPGASTYDATSKSDLLLVSQLSDPNGNVVQKTFAYGPATTVAQGAASGLGAVGLLEQAGDDVYRASSDGASAATTAQAAHTLAGAAVLVDGGGRDSMTATSGASPVLVMGISVTPPSPPPCPPGFTCTYFFTAHVEAGVFLPVLNAVTYAQAASETGASLFADLGGARGDRVAKAIAEPVAKASAAIIPASPWIITSNSTANATANVTGGSALVRAQGYARTGSATLLGSSGNDFNDILATTKMTAEATASGAPLAANNKAIANAKAGNADGKGQGWGQAGAGVLADPGGNDAYSVALTSSAVALQNGLPGGTTAGLRLWEGRGFAPTLGLGALLDLGGLDAYSSTPPPGDAEGADGTCWTNAPPGVPGNFNLGLGMDVSGLPLPPSCGPPPPN